MLNNTTYLITGANRGLGLAMTSTFLLRPSTTILAAVRDTIAPSSTALLSLPTGTSSTLILLQIDSLSPTDAQTAITHLLLAHRITHLDIVIANAAIGTTYPLPFSLTCAGITIDDMYSHFTINTIAPLLLFRAALPLLKNSKNGEGGGNFIIMSSFASSLTEMENCPFPNAAYGASKVSVNYLSRKMHFENEGLTVFALNPGWVRTDMGNAGARMFGMEEAGLSIDESVAGLVKVIDNSTREKCGGKLMEWNGKELNW